MMHIPVTMEGLYVAARRLRVAAAFLADDFFFGFWAAGF
jgi:hypothetical protein